MSENIDEKYILEVNVDGREENIKLDCRPHTREEFLEMALEILENHVEWLKYNFPFLKEE